MNEIPDFVEEIEDKTNRNFKLRNVPLPVLKEFKKFCIEECGDVYAVGLFQLLKIKKQYESLIPLMSNILKEVQEIKQKPKRRELKTFAE